MITERLMDVGGFDLDLSPSTPWEVRQAIYRGDQLYVFPTRIPDGSFPTATNLGTGGKAYWRGVITGHDQDRSRFSGASLLWLIGNAARIGRIVVYTGTGLGFLTLGGHLSWLLTQNSANLGGLNWVVRSGGTPQVAWPASGDEFDRLPRTVLDRLREVAANCGASWRDAGDGSIEYGSADSPNLHRGYDATPPTVLVTDTGKGEDISSVALDWTLAGGDVDIEGFIDRAVVAADGDLWSSYERSGGPYISNAVGVPTYRHSIDTAPSETTTDATERARAEVVARGQRSSLELDIHTPRIRSLVTPGDRIGIHLPSYGYTSSETTTFAGRTITPMRVEVVAVSWPIEPDMSVYAVDRTGTRPPVDLTPWVVPDRRPARFELGAPARWLRLPLR